MQGLMQRQPLLISNLIDFAERHHGDGEIVSRRIEGDIHSYNWADVAARSRQVGNALDALHLVIALDLRQRGLDHCGLRHDSRLSSRRIDRSQSAFRSR